MADAAVAVDLTDLTDSFDLIDPDNTSASPQATIAGGAELSLRAFQQCLHFSASHHPRYLALVEDQLARFSIWTSSIGVFSRGRASMDHRLREAPDVHYAVSSLLDSLVDSIQNCASILEETVDGQPDESKGTSNIPTGSLDYSINAVAKEISLLYRLSNTIRRASKESQNLKAAKSYRIQDEDGNDAEPMLEQLYAHYICGRFPSMQDSLQRRLASSMVLRRKRILYRRSRYGASPIRPKKTISQPKIEFPDTQIHAAVAADLPENSAEDPAVNLAPAKSTVQSQAASATTLAPDEYKKASTPSVISAAKTVALSNHEDLVFPSAPNGRARKKFRILKKKREEEHKAYLRSIAGFSMFEEHIKQQHSQSLAEPENLFLDSKLAEVSHKVLEAETRLKINLDLDWNDCHKAVAEVICPFCLYALPSLSVAHEKKWKAHVTNDLDAYVCLFDECDKPEQLYSHSSDWLRHMREHTLRWRCNSKAHRRLVFLTEGEYLTHMREGHPAAFTEPQLLVLAERNGRPITPMFESCPICGVDETTVRLEDHIVGHLRLLALRSLPAHEDSGSESSQGGDNSLGTSKPASRLTVKMDPDRHIKPTFKDPGDISNWNTAVSLTSPYAPWGGYVKYIATYPPGSAQQYQSDGADKVHHFLPPTTFDDEEVDEFSWDKDPSRDFIDQSLFDGVAAKDRRGFEWGFVTQNRDGRVENLQNDPIIHEILAYIHDKLEANSVAPDNGDSPLAVPGSSDTPVKHDPDDDAAQSSPFAPQESEHSQAETEETAAEVVRGKEEGSAPEPNTKVFRYGSKGKGEEKVHSSVLGSIGPVPHGDGAKSERNKCSMVEPDIDCVASDEVDVHVKPSHNPDDSAVHVTEAEPITKHLHVYDSDNTPFQLAEALKGTKRPEATPLIEILPGLTHEQVMYLRTDYKRIVKVGADRKGVNVAKHIRMRFKDEDPLLMKVCYTVALGRWESEAYWVNCWCLGNKIRRELLIESLIGHSNREIRVIKESFVDKRYENSLTRCMRSELNDGKFKNAVLMVLEGRRMEEYDKHNLPIPIDQGSVGEDVVDLYRAIHSEKGGEGTMINIVVRRSDSHLREVRQTYERQYYRHLASDVLRKCGNIIGELLLHILQGAVNRPARDAALLHHAITAQEDKLRRELLISRLVRIHWDGQHMRAVKKFYLEEYERELSDAVKESTSGNWGEFCVRLCVEHESDDVNTAEEEEKEKEGEEEKEVEGVGVERQT